MVHQGRPRFKDEKLGVITVTVDLKETDIAKKRGANISELCRLVIERFNKTGYVPNNDIEIAALDLDLRLSQLNELQVGIEAERERVLKAKEIVEQTLLEREAMVQTVAHKLVELAPAIRKGQQAGLKVEHLSILANGHITRTVVHNFINENKKITLEKAIEFLRKNMS
jgi:L-2-hydroxyglutarate oxidase LhgO